MILSTSTKKRAAQPLLNVFDELESVRKKILESSSREELREATAYILLFEEMLGHCRLALESLIASDYPRYQKEIERAEGMYEMSGFLVEKNIDELEEIEVR